MGNPRFSTLKQIVFALNLDVRDLFVLPPNELIREYISGFLKFEGKIFNKNY